MQAALAMQELSARLIRSPTRLNPQWPPGATSEHGYVSIYNGRTDWLLSIILESFFWRGRSLLPTLTRQEPIQRKPTTCVCVWDSQRVPVLFRRCLKSRLMHSDLAWAMRPSERKGLFRTTTSPFSSGTPRIPSAILTTNAAKRPVVT